MVAPTVTFVFVCSCPKKILICYHICFGGRDEGWGGEVEPQVSISRGNNSYQVPGIIAVIVYQDSRFPGQAERSGLRILVLEFWPPVVGAVAH